MLTLTTNGLECKNVGAILEASLTSCTTTSNTLGYTQAGNVACITGYILKSCPTKVIEKCSVTGGRHGNSNGTCQGGGTCSYSCNDGTWTKNNNTCTSPCSYTTWTNSGTCKASQGSSSDATCSATNNGKQKQTRTKSSGPSTCTDTTQWIDCKGTYCSSGACSNGSCSISCTPVNCSWGGWGGWSPSTSTQICGTSFTQTRTRSKTTTESCGGTCTGSSSQTQSATGTLCSSGTCNGTSCSTTCTYRAASWGTAPSCESASEVACGTSIPNTTATCNTGQNTDCTTINCTGSAPTRTCTGTGTKCSSGTCNGTSCSISNCSIPNPTTPGKPDLSYSSGTCTITAGESTTGYTYQYSHKESGKTQSSWTTSNTFTCSASTLYSVYVRRKGSDSACTNYSIWNFHVEWTPSDTCSYTTWTNSGTCKASQGSSSDATCSATNNGKQKQTRTKSSGPSTCTDTTQWIDCKGTYCSSGTCNGTSCSTPTATCSWTTDKSSITEGDSFTLTISETNNGCSYGQAVYCTGWQSGSGGWGVSPSSKYLSMSGSTATATQTFTTTDDSVDEADGSITCGNSATSPTRSVTVNISDNDDTVVSNCSIPSTKSWSVGSNTCYTDATITQYISPGTSFTLNDNNIKYSALTATGSISADCSSSGVLSYSSPVCVTPGCSALSINGCSISAKSSNGTFSGTCGTGYTGTCSYTCSNGSWSAVTACIVDTTPTPPPGCSALSRDGCSISAKSSNGNFDGTCGTGYTGSCSYTCSNGSWSAVTTCTTPPTCPIPNPTRPGKPTISYSNGTCTIGINSSDTTTGYTYQYAKGLGSWTTSNTFTCGAGVYFTAKIRRKGSDSACTQYSPSNFESKKTPYANYCGTNISPNTKSCPGTKSSTGTCTLCTGYYATPVDNPKCWSGWRQYNNWSTTVAKTCNGHSKTCNGSTSCTTEFHSSYSNTARETCEYIDASRKWANCVEDTLTCRAKVQYIGCVPK